MSPLFTAVVVLLSKIEAFVQRAIIVLNTKLQKVPMLTHMDVEYVRSTRRHAAIAGGQQLTQGGEKLRSRHW